MLKSGSKRVKKHLEPWSDGVLENNEITSVCFHNQHPNTPVLRNQSAILALKPDWDF